MSRTITPASRQARRLSLLLLPTIALQACGSEERSGGWPSEEAPLSERLAALSTDLGSGHRGDDVRTVQQYLRNFGYFPNDDLATQYPRWRPLVGESPAASLYDRHTEAAVRAFQQMYGLVQTGRVDAATRAALRQPRCGVPDGVAPLDPRDKFAIISGEPWWNRLNLTWRFHPNWYDRLDAATARAEIAQALATWGSASSLQFTETTGDADIDVRFAFRETPAAASPPPWGDIHINAGQAWSVATPTPGHLMDFQSAVLHEVGHTLGLAHSSRGTNDNLVMFPGLPFGAQRRILSTDDTLAIQFNGTSWEPLTGCAKDVGVHDHVNVWVIGCDFPGTTGKVYKFIHGTSSWIHDSYNTGGGGFVTGQQIAVDALGQPWIQTGNGTVMRKNSSNPTTGSWSTVLGCVHDIGIARSSNDVWGTECGPADGRILKFNHAGGIFEPDALGMTGRRIAVDAVGRPWIVKANGTMYRRTSADRTSGSWVQVPGEARDIGVTGTDEGLQAWHLGLHDERIYMWNEQPAIGDATEGGAGAPFRAGWARKSGGANRISVGPGGPWIINSAGTLYRETKYW
jgi:hypothetical protein